MQRAFVNKIYDLAEHNENIVLLTADNGTDFDVLFARAFPEQYYNLGIAEENMVAAAAGMAMCGKIPFVLSGGGAFLAYRAYEFIRDDVCFQNQNVKFVALGSGLSISALGPTHHTTEDISALKALPGLRLLSAASPLEVDAVMEDALSYQGPVYLRLGMNATEEFHAGLEEIRVDGVNSLCQGQDAVLFVTGDSTGPAVRAAAQLKEQGVHVEVCEILCLKPLPGDDIVAKCQDGRALFCVEEHNIIGGLGESIASLLNAHGIANPLHKIGLNDCFAKGFAPQSDLQDFNGLDANALCQRILAEVKR